MNALPVCVCLIAVLAVGLTAGDLEAAQAQRADPAPRAAAEADADEIRRRVKEGQKVVVIDDQGRQLAGRITELRSDALLLSVGGKSTDVPYGRVVRIRRPDDRLWDGALKGLITGAGFGLLLGLSDDSGFRDVVLVGAPLIFGGIGAAVGTGVDALIRRDPTLYSRELSTRMSLSPAGARVAFSVTW